MRGKIKPRCDLAEVSSKAGRSHSAGRVNVVRDEPAEDAQARWVRFGLSLVTPERGASEVVSCGPARPRPRMSKMRNGIKVAPIAGAHLSWYALSKTNSSSLQACSVVTDKTSEM